MNNRTTRKRIVAVVVLLSIIVISGVFWWLRYEGITMADEAFCGLDEHTHTEECLANNCTIPEHIHTASCYSNDAADVENAAIWEATINKKAFTQDVAKDMITIATSQLGYTESSKNFDIDDSGTRCGYTRYGEWYGNKYGHWSAMFVSFCLNYANVTDDSALINSGSAAMLKAWQDAGLTTQYPVAGDIVFIDAKGKGSCTDVGVVISVGNNITVIHGNSNDKVEKLTYSADDSKILGYGSVYRALEKTLTEKETDRIEFVRNLASELPGEDEIVDKMIELGDTSEFNVWRKELVQQIKIAYYYYDLLPAKLEPLVYNVDRILDLNYLWQSNVLDGEEDAVVTYDFTIPVHQINAYETFNQYIFPETYSTICTKPVSEAVSASYPWWHAYVIEKHEDGYFYVADINRNTGDAHDKRDMKAQSDEGFVYLIWLDHPLRKASESIEIGNIVEVTPEAMLEAPSVSENMALGELNFVIGSDHYVENDVFALGSENLALGKDYNMSLLYSFDYSNWDGTSPVKIAYPDEGNVTLTDGIIADGGFDTAEWMGFHTNAPDFAETGMYVNVDLGEVYNVGKVVLFCGSDKLGAGITSPDAVRFYASLDGNTYEHIGTVVPTDDASQNFVEVSLRCNVQARYIKAHMDPGSSWVFVSEFEAYEALEAPTIIESADTSSLISVNLYDYENNINFPYYRVFTDVNGTEQTVHDQFYPGFSQGGGSRYIYSSLSTGQLNYGDNIHTNRESGEYGVTSNANSDRENTGKINQTNADSPANLPIENAMYPWLVNGYPATWASDGVTPLSLAYLFDNAPHDFEPNDTAGAEIYSHKQNTNSINGLFQYDEATGTYHFDSREHFARFNAEDDTFTLFEQNISPNFIMYPFGNFLPLNDIETEATQMSQIDRDWFIKIAKRALYRSNLIESEKGSGMVYSWDGLSFHDGIFLSGEPNESNIANYGFSSFPINYFNPTAGDGIIADSCWLVTEDITANTPASYSNYAVAVLLKPSEDIEGVYEVVDRIVGDGTGAGTTFSETPTDGMIVLMAHTSQSAEKTLFATQRADELASFMAGQKVRFAGVDITDGKVTTTGTTQYFYTAPGTSDLVIPEPGTGSLNINSLCPNDYLTMIFTIRNMIKNADTAYGEAWTYTDLVAKYFATIDSTLFANFRFPEEAAEKIFCIDYDKQKNFFFGMDMTFEFIQPKDGLTGPNGDATMIYRFAGDDDVWIYLDDVLFLDLSGIHRHVGGTIDFTNGIVTYNELNPETGDVDYNIPVAGMTKTFREILLNVGYSETQISKMLSPKGGFADYSEHTFKFYYMERGSGSGVCRMDFNVPLIESNRIMVSKEVDKGENAILGNPDYYFQILHADAKDSLYFDEGTKFTIISDANPTGYTSTVGRNGIFTLKAGQTAIFSAQANAGDYVVRELFAEDVYQQYGEVEIKVNGENANSGQYTDVADTVVIDGDLGDTAWRDDDWIYVYPSKGYGVYQHPTEYTQFDVADFRYQIRNDGNKAYFAVEYYNAPTGSTDNGTTGTKIRVWAHDGESALTNYTGFYDVYMDGEMKTTYTGWKNVGTSATHQKEQIVNSTIQAASRILGDSWLVEFSVDLTEIGGEDKDFKFFFNVMDKFTVTTETVTTDEETSETVTTTTTTYVNKVLLYPGISTTKFPYELFVSEKALDINDPLFVMGTHPVLGTDSFTFENVTIGNVNYKYVESIPIDISNGYATVDFTNIVDETKLGKLAVEKELTDDITNNYDVTFKLRITLDGEPVPVGTSYWYINAEDPDNRILIPVTADGEVTIKPGYRVEFDNLLVGTVYTVEELDALKLGYDVHYHHGTMDDEADMTEKDEATGTIHDYGSTCTLIVHNVKDGVKVVVNGEKTLGYTNNQENTFNFTLTQVDQSLNPIANGTVMTSSVAITEGTQPFSFVISYPAESTQPGTYYYLIEESDADGLVGMDTTQYLLTVVVTSNGANDIEAQPTLVKLGSENETVDTASFHNDIYQALTINKEILGFYNGGAFKFTITATRHGTMIIGDFPCIYPDGTVGYLTFTASKANVELNDNQSITVYLPYGTAWRVDEESVTGCDTHVGFTKDQLMAATYLSGMLTEDRTVYFVNIFGTELPSTGSNMRLIITYCGIGLLAVAFAGACLFRISRKRRNKK